MKLQERSPETYDSETDRWWDSKAISRIPGTVVPFFGAGLSIESPSSLPGGMELTRKLVDHLFDPETGRELLSKFSENPEVLGRSVPRLEHLLSLAIRANTKAANLLNIFENVPPNRNHHAIARYLCARRGWAITTNFDDCVEQASGYTIPIHVFDAEEGKYESYMVSTVQIGAWSSFMAQSTTV